jgi:hypothetical protein
MSTIDRTLVPAAAADAYRDVHKGIRHDLFALTVRAGTCDPGSAEARADLARAVRTSVGFLAQHAQHEDRGLQPTIDRVAPDLGERIAAEHPVLEARMDVLVELAGVAAAAPRTEQRARVHQLYLELSSFTSAYLAHQDFEERVVQPALVAAIGTAAAEDLHAALVATIPPAEMGAGLGLMLPAMNVEERVELLRGVQAHAPAPVFEGVWGLAGAVLAPADHVAVAARLGLVGTGA